MTLPRILLADDHQEMRDAVEKLLKSEFEIVGVVAGGRELLAAEAQSKPDVCVLDISMPNVSGITVAHQLRREGSQTKVVFLTIYDDPDFLQAALDTGALGYVLKSRMVADLGLAIKSALGGQLFVSPSRNLGTDEKS